MRFIDVDQTLGTPGEQQWFGGLVFLINGNRGVSFTETVVGAIIDGNLGTLVGEPTAGANGDLTTLDLPAGFQTSWSGVRVLRNDGSTLFGVGFSPDHHVSRTQAGVAADEDEILAFAYQLLAGAGHEPVVEDIGLSLAGQRRANEENVELQEITVSGWSFLVPQDWTPSEPNILMRSLDGVDPAAVAYAVVAATGEAAFQEFFDMLGLPREFLTLSRTVNVTGREWTVWSYSAPAVSLVGNIAFTEESGETLFLSVQAPGDEGSLSYRSVLLPSMENTRK